MEKLKLLYVDDEDINLANFDIAFKDHFHIFTAESGKQALEIFDSNPDIAIVVADQRMPGMTGVELLSEILNRNEDTVRIILTAYTEVSDIIDSINKGKIYQYVVKPWVEHDLLQLLRKASNTYHLVQENRRLLRALDQKNQDLQADIAQRKRIEGILLRRDMILAAVTLMAKELLLNKDWQLYIEELIARLGMVMAVSRVYVFSHQTDSSGDICACQKYEWSAEGVATHSDCLYHTKFSYKKINLDRWLHKFEQGQLIYGNTEDFSMEEASWLKACKVKSIANAPILVDEVCWGFISFEDCRSEKGWAAPELDALNTAATLVGTAIQRENMENMLAAHQAQLAHAGRLTAMGEMASGMGHEINQPLTVISLSAETCKSYFLQKDPHCPAAEAAEEMLVNVKKISNIIQSMRSFSRASSGNWKKISLHWPLGEALTFFREQFRIHGIDYEEYVSRNLPLVNTDGQKFEQIIVNFLSNARYSVDKKEERDKNHRKKIMASLYYKQVTDAELDLFEFKKGEETSNQVIVFEVKDNGIGMNEEVRRRCLEPFYTTKEVGEGTGLGLSVTLGIIRELNFHLEIESQEGQGAVFRVVIPVEQDERIG